MERRCKADGQQLMKNASMSGGQQAHLLVLEMGENAALRHLYLHLPLLPK